MPSKLLQTVIGSSGVIELAPDLSWPSDKQPGKLGTKIISGIDGTTGGLVSVLQLTGRYIVSYILLSSLVNESITLKLTIDGVVIWNSTFTLSATDFLAIGSGDGIETYETTTPFVVNSSMSLEITTITADSITCRYIAKPIK